MRTRTIAAAALLGMMIVGSGRADAQNGGTAMSLTPADHAEIRHILTSLNQGADFNDSDLWVSQWTPDGSWTRPDGESFVGHDRLREYRRSTRVPGGGASSRRHWTNGVVLTPTAEGATGRTYYMLLDISVVPPTVATAGHYEDVSSRIRIRSDALHFPSGAFRGPDHPFPRGLRLPPLCRALAGLRTRREHPHRAGTADNPPPPVRTRTADARPWEPWNPGVRTATGDVTPELRHHVRPAHAGIDPS